MMENKSIDNLIPVEDYYPQQTPRSLHVLLGKREMQRTNRKFDVKTINIDPFTMLAMKVQGSMDNFEVGQEVRKGWKKLQEIISSKGLVLMEENVGIVFYNQGNMVQPDGTIELWIGVRVNDTTCIPDECKSVSIPKRKYAKIDCNCFSRKEMDLRYKYLNEWIKEEGYLLDDGPDAFSLEPNRLDSFNPFDVPAHEIQAFDFDILYPIKER